MRRTLAFVAAALIAAPACAQMAGGVMESQKQGTAAITSGAINGTTVGATTASTGRFTTLTVTSNGNVVNVQNAGTAETYSRWRNGTADAFFGIESSAGAQLIAGSAAYSTVITSNNAAPVYLGYQGAIKAQTSATGFTVTGALTADSVVSNGAISIPNGVSLALKDSTATGRQAVIWANTDEVKFGDTDNLTTGSVASMFGKSAVKQYVNASVVTNTTSTGMAITGNVTTTTAPVLTGSATNDSAAAGKIGELLTGTLAVGSQITLTTATAANVITLSVTAGDWDCSGQVTHNAAGTTSVTLLQIGISATSATLPTQAGGSGIGTDPLAIWRQAAAVPGGALTTSVGPVRVSLSGTTNIFLVANDTFTVAGMQAYGTLRCRRMR